MSDHLLKYAEGVNELKALSEYFFKAMNTDEDIVDEGEKKREEVVETLKKVGVAVGVAAGVALFGWGISKLVNGNDDQNNKILMKAPGRDNCYIFRDVFENNPSSYFRDLRKNN